MDAIREQFKNPVVTAVVALIVGLFIGLVVLGWWLWPVKFTGASPKDLTYQNKVEYLHMTIEAFGETKDVQKARERYNALGSDGEKALSDVMKEPGNITPDLIQLFAAAMVSGQVPVSPGATQGAITPGATIPPTKAPPSTLAPSSQASGGSFLGSILPILCGIFLILIVGVAVFFFLRSRGSAQMTGGVGTAPVQQAQQTTWKDYPAAGVEPPMVQFMASYKLGDDLFDDSFSIDSPSGEFMGECGVGISETIGVGDPKKVTAFEVWLFDKNDIQTVTKVLMSAHAFSDDMTRSRLAAKGEPLQVEPGTEAELETQSLRLVARVVDMGYGDGAMPSESYFDRFILELAVWTKA
jgi:hypothetical protein